LSQSDFETVSFIIFERLKIFPPAVPGAGRPTLLEGGRMGKIGRANQAELSPKFYNRGSISLPALSTWSNFFFNRFGGGGKGEIIYVHRFGLKKRIESHHRWGTLHRDGI
jgi:hypothetical protein